MNDDHSPVEGSLPSVIRDFQGSIIENPFGSEKSVRNAPAPYDDSAMPVLSGTARPQEFNHIDPDKIAAADRVDSGQTHIFEDDGSQLISQRMEGGDYRVWYKPNSDAEVELTVLSGERPVLRAEYRVGRSQISAEWDERGDLCKIVLFGCAVDSPFLLLQDRNLLCNAFFERKDDGTWGVEELINEATGGRVSGVSYRMSDDLTKVGMEATVTQGDDGACRVFCEGKDVDYELIAHPETDVILSIQGPYDLGKAELLRVGIPVCLLHPQADTPEEIQKLMTDFGEAHGATDELKGVAEDLMIDVIRGQGSGSTSPFGQLPPK